MARLGQLQFLEGQTYRIWNVAQSPKGIDVLWGVHEACKKQYY